MDHQLSFATPCPECTIVVVEPDAGSLPGHAMIISRIGALANHRNEPVPGYRQGD
ncbi:hypothetical protein [Sphingomonas sp. 35-24ZXX]|uniref:hypothetical protein n=1 Tax=Sphingomonas sp. 35-24ZXX TaxID=1545915 RepID=UPI001E5C6B2F|nr:hypothetical protein [Sphingomonas sp. 35-24ZXX]